jgi:hypothetical protein
VTPLPFFYSLLQSSFPFVRVLTLLSSLSLSLYETYGNRYLLLFLVLVLFVLVLFVVVLDLMTRPRRRPFFLYPLVNASPFPREG